ncbi:DUF4383 domain-containing protein [Calidithermus chliarophilus]|uniref:DUF4383 domain-containing protein n=1 Tax=Calidithermus chliarophilus TaxID=52023 RepID=UPI0004018655|nr:DUF4383 domain-containing protein [Calidithermus chliarophilus]
MFNARTIDLWTGLVFVALGVLGLFFTQNGLLLGFLPTNIGMQIVYLLTGGVLLYAFYNGVATAHAVSALVGIVYAALGVLGLFMPSFLGLPTNGWNIAVNLIAAAVLIYDWLGTPEPSRA